MRAVISVLLLLALATPGGALADSARERANKLFKAGLARYDAKDYKGALSLYEQANKLFNSPQIEFNMALSREKLGQPALAAVHYERFLGKADQLAYPKKVKAVKAKLAALRKKLATVSVSYATRGAAVDMDGKPVGKTPLGHRIYRKPGEFRLTVKKDGYRIFQKNLKLGAGSHEEVKVTLEPISRDAPGSPVAEPVGKGKPAAAPSTAAPPAGVTGPAPTGEPPTAVPPAAVTAPGKVPPAGGAKTSRPIYKKWWFWTAIGVVAAGVTAGVVASQTGGSDRVPSGELGGFSFR